MDRAVTLFVRLGLNARKGPDRNDTHAVLPPQA